LIGEVIKRVAFLRFFYFPFPVRKKIETPTPARS
jgi:polysaccharide biosynthesis protein PslL